MKFGWRFVLGYVLGAFAASAVLAAAEGQGPVPGLQLPATVDQWTMIVGILLPLAIAAVNRSAWGSIAKALAALGCCLIAAAGDVVLKEGGAFTLAHIGQNALAIFFLVVTTYHGFWKPTGIADAVEKRTG